MKSIQSMGGEARAKALTTEEKTSIAKTAAAARSKGHVPKPKQPAKPRVPLREKVKILAAALWEIADWKSGPEVSSSFDEPGSARMAREALEKAEITIQ